MLQSPVTNSRRSHHECAVRHSFGHTVVFLCAKQHRKHLQRSGLHETLRESFGTRTSHIWLNLPLVVALIAGGVPLVASLIWRGTHGQFGADHLAGISIVAPPCSASISPARLSC